MNTRTCMRTLASLVLFCALACSARAHSYPAEQVLPNADGVTLSAILGETEGGFTGYSVARAGDINADGIEDFVVGSYGIDQATGRAHVIFGIRGKYPAEMTLSSIDGSNGFALEGISTLDAAGIVVAAAGDLNADGIDDVVIGASAAGPGTISGPGECYVVFGRATAFPATLPLAGLDGSNGFTIRGRDEVDQCGFATSAGDVNDDGIDDLLVSAAEANPGGLDNAGEAYVVYGSDAGFPTRIDVDTLDGTNGFAIPGLAAGDFLGSGIAAAGDVNADGIDDVILNAHGVKPDGVSTSGETYVIFGNDAGFAAAFDLASLDGSNGFVVTGRPSIDQIYAPVASGDWNDDGIADLAMGTTILNGAGSSDDETGAYVIFGSDAGFAASFDVTALDGTNGFRLNLANAGDSFALDAIATRGDLDDDGIGDLVVGAHEASGRNAVFAIFGDDSFDAVVDASDLDGPAGFTLHARSTSQLFGLGLSLGDVNDDGIDDLLIGAALAPGIGQFPAGEAYVFYGIPDCRRGTVNAANGIILNSLFVNGSTGGSDRVVELTTGDFVGITMLRPIAGGNGRFVVHADEGDPTAMLSSPLPFDVGAMCFPFLLSKGGSPEIVANNLGKEGAIGASNFYGVPLPNPERASTTFTYPPLPLGLQLTFQGVVIDPGSFSSRRASTTNAVTIRIID